MKAPAYRLIRTDAGDPAFQALVAELDKDLAIRDGEDHAFYDQFNKLHDIKHAVVVFDGSEPVGCGAFKPSEGDAVEIKRMRWAHELGYQRGVLETGVKQPEAIALYTKRGYRIIPNYGQYAGVETSVCFEKELGR